MRTSARLMTVIAMLNTAACQGLPSIDHCQHVSYIRDRDIVTINATCQLPVGAPALPMLPKP